MPRRKNAVKSKSAASTTVSDYGAVDLHFHGAFGIDLMTAAPPELDELARKLAEAGVAAFCPTTLSVDAPTLKATVERLGAWIRGFKPEGGSAAIPLGIHLEGPFISSHACGAHPPGSIRPLSWTELEALWSSSQQTLKILTIAPETLASDELEQLVAWAKKRKVHLSLGHSKATEEQARAAFEAGFRGVTHTWNALNFHHRAAGVLGAAIGRKNVFLELIIDQVHVSPTVIGWTRALHPKDQIVFVSDCVPAAATDESAGPFSFGPLKIRYADGACRLPDGGLAGGGLLLPVSFGRWLQVEARRTGKKPSELLRRCLPQLNRAPLKALGLSPTLLRAHRVKWALSSKGELTAVPVASTRRR